MLYVLDENNDEFIISLYVKMIMIPSNNGFKNSKEFGSKLMEEFVLCAGGLLLFCFGLFSIYKTNMVVMV